MVTESAPLSVSHNKPHQRLQQSHHHESSYHQYPHHQYDNRVHQHRAQAHISAMEPTGRAQTPTDDQVSSAADAMLKLSASVPPNGNNSNLPVFVVNPEAVAAAGGIAGLPTIGQQQSVAFMQKQQDNTMANEDMKPDLDRLKMAAAQVAAHASSRAARKQREFIPEFKKDDHYWMKRRKNNEAAKRSREKRRMNDMALTETIGSVRSENEALRRELQALKKKYGLPLEQTFPYDPSEPLLLQSSIAVSTSGDSDANNSPHYVPTATTSKNSSVPVFPTPMSSTSPTPQHHPMSPGAQKQQQSIVTAVTNGLASPSATATIPFLIPVQSTGANGQPGMALVTHVPHGLNPAIVTSLTLPPGMTNSGTLTSNGHSALQTTMPVANSTLTNGHQHQLSYSEMNGNSHHQNQQHSESKQHQPSDVELMDTNSTDSRNAPTQNHPHQYARNNQLEVHHHSSNNTSGSSSPHGGNLRVITSSSSEFSEDCSETLDEPVAPTTATTKTTTPKRRGTDPLNLCKREKDDLIVGGGSTAPGYIEIKPCPLTPPGSASDTSTGGSAKTCIPHKLRHKLAQHLRDRVAFSMYPDEQVPGVVTSASGGHQQLVGGTMSGSSTECGSVNQSNQSQSPSMLHSSGLPSTLNGFGDHDDMDEEDLGESSGDQYDGELTIDHRGIDVKLEDSSSSDGSPRVLQRKMAAIDPKYVERRRRNNQAARKCRENRKAMMDVRIAKSSILETENQRLKEELQNLSSEVSTLKDLIVMKNAAKAKGESFDPPPMKKVKEDIAANMSDQRSSSPSLEPASSPEAVGSPKSM